MFGFRVTYYVIRWRRSVPRYCTVMSIAGNCVDIRFVHTRTAKWPLLLFCLIPSAPRHLYRDRPFGESLGTINSLGDDHRNRNSKQVWNLSRQRPNTSCLRAIRLIVLISRSRDSRLHRAASNANTVESSRSEREREGPWRKRGRKGEIVRRTPRFPYYLHGALVHLGRDPVTHITMCHRLNLIHDRCPS